MSLKRMLKRGRVKPVWNDLFKRLDFYRVSNRGRWIMCNPANGQFIQKGPGYATQQILAMQKQ
jgi:hypothetical protein